MVKHLHKKLSGIFNHFRSFKSMVIGDFLLDTYTTGRVKRISPEAPVPVMEVLKHEARPGGAGNVALNLASLGSEVYAVGRVGNDFAAEELKAHLKKNRIDTQSLFLEPAYKTPVKNRLIAENQQVLRVDHETIASLTPEMELFVVGKLQELIPQMDVIAISDYGKGFLTPTLLRSAIQIAKKAKIPLIVDPKGIDFLRYKGATLLKPNLSEAYAAAKMSPSEPLETIAHQLLDSTKVDLLLITRSELGMSLFDQRKKRIDFPVQVKEVVDVTGAGDTVLALICLSMALHLDIEVGAELANIAAGIAIERLGCAQVTLSDLAGRLLEYDCESKIFDESHADALQQVMGKKPYSLLILDPDPNLLEVVRALKHLENEKLVVYVSDPQPPEEFIHFLSAMREVDSILLQGLSQFCQALTPQKTYVIREGKAVLEQGILT